MSIYTAIMVYVIAWWLIFFMLLPIGVQTHHEVGEEVEPGNAPSAPVRPHLKRKVLAATLIAAVVWGAFYWVEESDMIRIRPDFTSHRLAPES